MPRFTRSVLTAALALATFGTLGTAQAADIEVYGRLDTGFLYTMNHGDAQDTTEMTSGRSTGSRWGLKGSEALTSDGWAVRFVLESGFDSDTGEFSSSGKLFGRQSTLSLYHHSYGELAFGRSGKPMSGADQFTRIGSFTPFGVTYGDAGLLFYGKGGRVDNGIFYRSPKLAGFRVVLAGSLNTSGSEAEKWNDNNRFLGGTVDYTYGNFGVMLGAERIFMSDEDYADNDDADPTTFFVGAKYDLGFMELMGGYQRGWGLDRVGALQSIKIGKHGETAKNAQIQDWDGNSYMIGARIPAWGGSVRLSGIYVEGENSRNIANNNVGDLGRDAGYYALGAGYVYPFSKRTNVYGVVSHLEGRKGLAKDYNIYNGDGDLDRTTIAVGLVHKF